MHFFFSIKNLPDCFALLAMTAELSTTMDRLHIRLRAVEEWVITTEKKIDDF
jgi:hypothetical protein